VALLQLIGWGTTFKAVGPRCHCRYLLNAHDRQHEPARPDGAWVEHGDPSVGADEWHVRIRGHPCYKASASTQAKRPAAALESLGTASWVGRSLRSSRAPASPDALHDNQVAALGPMLSTLDRFIFSKKFAFAQVAIAHRRARDVAKWSMVTDHSALALPGEARENASTPVWS
jgi:hypothetical protein